MGHSVLIVDDDRELRAIYRAILSREGYTIYEAANGAEALSLLKTETPDVLMMDMLMPMLGGDAMLQRIHQMPSLSAMRIVVLTAYPRFRESAVHFQVDQFLVKPIRPDELVQAIRAAISQQQHTPD